MPELIRTCLDVESCGFNGPVVLIQYGTKDDITLHHVWKVPVRDTLELIEMLMERELVLFNATFDLWHLVRIYNLFKRVPDHWIPEEHIEELERLDTRVDDPWFLRPARTIDLFLFGRQNSHNYLVNRDGIYIRRIPIELSGLLAEHLSENLYLDPLLFKGRADQTIRWQTTPSKIKGEFSADFDDVYLAFSPKATLKALASTLGYEVEDFDDHLPDAERPDYDPFGGWGQFIASHIDHWASNSQAIKYAKNDIVFTDALDEHYGRPEQDTNSVLTSNVANVRFAGYEINAPEIENLLQQAQVDAAAAPVNVNAPKQVRAYLEEVMDDIEQMVLVDGGTKANTLKSIKKLGNEEATKRADIVMKARSAGVIGKMFQKLLAAACFFVNTKVYGTKSGRMSGTGGLNAQGIPKDDRVRSAFPLKRPDEDMVCFDFSALEVTILAALCSDPKLEDALRSGKKFHAIIGAAALGVSYDEVMNTKELYGKAKGITFTIQYLGDAGTLQRKQQMDVEESEAVFERIFEMYPGMAEFQNREIANFKCMEQPDGGQVHWNDPKERKSTTMFGVTRDFSIEYKVLKTLYDLAESPPKDWNQFRAIKVVRSQDRLQTGLGATRSALYGAAFGLQGAIVRAAVNHLIQATGADITKRLQARIWNLQPVGIHRALVRPFNVHDEVNTPCRKGMAPKIAQVVRDFVAEYRKYVPLLDVDMNEDAQSWAEKE